MAAVKLLIGVLMLVAGQQFFWFLICALGFLAGIYIFTVLWSYFGPSAITGLWWMFVAASGILGSVFLAIFFKPALVIISSFIGAMIIAQSMQVAPHLRLLLLALLFIIGIFIQYS